MPKKNQKIIIIPNIFTCKSNTHLEKSVPGLLKAEFPKLDISLDISDYSNSQLSV